MKKSLILVGLLSIGYAHAQEGRVGINTETPSATLHVKTRIGASRYTKNFELENSANKKLVTVLDSGSFGIGVEDPYADEVNINNRIRFSYNTRSWGIGIAAYTSVWARGYNFTSIDGSTKFGGFAAYGGNNTLDYFFIGNDYTAPIINFVASSKNIGMGINNPSNKLHIKADSNPVRLEGLQAGSATDKVVVVDARGVLKTVERGSIGGGTQGISVEADGVIGNEVVDATQNGGLVRAGSGTADAPYTLGIKEGGVTGGMLSAGAVTGDKIAPSSVDSSKLANGSVTSDKLNISGAEGQVLTYKGNQWVASTPSAAGLTQEVDGIVGNEVVDATQNGGLVRAGRGTEAEPYTLGLIPGTADGQVMVWNALEGKWKAQALQNGGSLDAITGNIKEVPVITESLWTPGVFGLIQTTTGGAIDLPDPVNYRGRIIAVNNQAGTPVDFGKNSPSNYSVIEGGSGFLLMSSGSKWYVIGGGI